MNTSAGVGGFDSDEGRAGRGSLGRRCLHPWERARGGGHGLH